MDRRSLTDKSQEGTKKPTGKPRNSNFSRKLLLENYTWHESTDDQRELHGDPRDKHDNDFTPSDDDSGHGYGHPGVGIGPVPDFYASTSFASDQGTLAGTHEDALAYWATLTPHEKQEATRFANDAEELIRKYRYSKEGAIEIIGDSQPVGYKAFKDTQEQLHRPAKNVTQSN